jgi:hypothetical protein
MPISTIQSGSFPSNVAIDTDTLVVDGANNRVGVGTANPQNKVHIVAGSSGSSTFDSRYNLTIEDDGENYIGIYSPNNSYGGVRFVNADNSIRGNIDYYHGTNGDKMLFYAQNEYQFSYPGTGVQHVFKQNGTVGIGTLTPSGAKLEIFTASTAVDGLKISRYTPGNYYSTLRQDSHGLAIHVGTGGTVSERVAITPNGITFNGDTAAADALDDYEEGTWTPSAIVTYSSPTLSNISSTGLYVKIGKVVYCWFKCKFSTNGAGNIGMSGLPFAGSGGYNVGSCRENSSTGNMYILEGLSSTSINVFRRYDNNGCYNGTNEMNGAFMYETT